MSGVWHKTLVYLGLVEEPDDIEELPERAVAGAREPARTPRARRHDVVDVTEDRTERGASNVRPLRLADSGNPHVRSVPPEEIHVTIVRVEQFEDVEQIGARYRSGQPVLFDLSRVETPVARRVLDFVSGVTYALQGKLSPAGNRAFLLVPEGVELPPRERERLASLGYGGDQ